MQGPQNLRSWEGFGVGHVTGSTRRTTPSRKSQGFRISPLLTLPPPHEPLAGLGPDFLTGGSRVTIFTPDLCGRSTRSSPSSGRAPPSVDRNVLTQSPFLVGLPLTVSTWGLSGVGSGNNMSPLTPSLPLSGDWGER